MIKKYKNRKYYYKGKYVSLNELSTIFTNRDEPFTVIDYQGNDVTVSTLITALQGLALNDKRFSAILTYLQHEEDAIALWNDKAFA